MSDYTKFIEGSATNILVQLVKYIDVRSGVGWSGLDDGDKLTAAGHEVDNAIAAELDASYYTCTLEGALEVMAESDNAGGMQLRTSQMGEYITFIEVACMFAHEVADTALRAEIENQQESIGAVWAVVIGDTCVDMEYHTDGDKDSPNGTHYWYTYRNQEVECPKCEGGVSGASITPALLAALRARCPCCMGSGYVTGEAFSVMRWKAPNVVLTHILGDEADGSVDEPDNAYGQVQTTLGEPIEVCDYDPEHDTESSWRWKHGIASDSDWADLDDAERAEYTLLCATRAAGVL